jgi:hypothetical protein
VARARIEAMPLRRFEGKDGVYLPAHLHGWLMNAGEGSVIDVGVLAVLFALEHADAPFAGGEVVNGAITLDAAHGFALLPGLNPHGEFGEQRVRESVAYLARNRWLETETVQGRTSIRRGERARKLTQEATAAVS